MTTRIELPGPGLPKMYMYSSWCYRNLFVPGEPKTWAHYNSFPNEDPGKDYMIFRDAQDAVAFRLHFGI